ncbi:MAG: HIT family protein [Betaproteobacteria bacterium]
MTTRGCVFCDSDGGRVLWRDAGVRVIAPEEPDHPGLLRVVWNEHVAEMTDLAPRDRDHLMRVVFAVEDAARRILVPDKMNLASLGNVVPHLHWHVVPRFTTDPHFPDPVWGARLRDRPVAIRADFRDAMVAQLATALE